MKTFDTQLNEIELATINAGGGFKDTYEDLKYVYKDLRDHSWDGICDFSRGFWDGLTGN